MMKRLLLASITTIGLACAHTPAETQQDPSPPAIRSRHIDVGGYELNFRYTEGQFPAIVFESGGGQNAEQWTDIQKYIARTLGRATVSYDRAGHGESELPSDEYVLADEAKALHTGLEQLGLAEQVIVVAHSYGGFVAQMYAHHHGDSVEHVLYLDPNNPYFVEEIGGPEVLGRYFDPKSMPDSRFKQAILRIDRAFADTVAAARDVGRGETPCTVMTGAVGWWDSDAMNRAWRAGQVKMAQACGSPLVVADGAEHMLPAEAFDLVMATIRKLINA